MNVISKHRQAGSVNIDFDRAIKDILDALIIKYERLNVYVPKCCNEKTLNLELDTNKDE